MSTAISSSGLSFRDWPRNTQRESVHVWLHLHTRREIQRFQTLFKGCFSIDEHRQLIAKKSGLNSGLTEAKIVQLFRLALQYLGDDGIESEFPDETEHYVVKLQEETVRFYQLRERIHSSQFAKVYFALCLTTGEKKVIKKGRPGNSLNAHLIAREGKFFSQVHSQGPVWGLAAPPEARLSSNPMLIFHAYNKRDFWSIIQERKDQEAQRSRLYETAQLLGALRHLSQLNLCHLDINPENILAEMGSQGRVRLYLGDLAGVWNKTETIKQRKMGDVISSMYIPREDLDYFRLLCSEGRMDEAIELGKKMDIFSIGTLIFYNYTYASPYMFLISNILQNEKIVHSYYPDFRRDQFGELDKRVDKELYILITKMLAKDYRERPSAEEAFRQFHDYLHRYSPELYDELAKLYYDQQYVNVNLS